MPRRVVLRPEVTLAIREADWSTDVELGAWLYGRIVGDELVAEVASGWREGGRVYVRLDRESLLAREAAYPAWRCVGDIHSHCRSRGDELRSSSADDQVCLDMAVQQPAGVYCGVIVGPGRDESFPFARPEFRAYLAVAADKTVRPIPLVLEQATYAA
jgi:hypothetical protein